MLKSIDVECPACGANVGEHCKTLTGKAMPEGHSKRKRAALAKQHPHEASSTGSASVKEVPEQK